MSEGIHIKLQMTKGVVMKVLLVAMEWPTGNMTYRLYKTNVAITVYVYDLIYQLIN